MFYNIYKQLHYYIMLNLQGDSRPSQNVPKAYTTFSTGRETTQIEYYSVTMHSSTYQ